MVVFGFFWVVELCVVCVHSGWGWSCDGVSRPLFTPLAGLSYFFQVSSPEILLFVPVFPLRWSWARPGWVAVVLFCFGCPSLPKRPLSSLSCFLSFLASPVFWYRDQKDKGGPIEAEDWLRGRVYGIEGFGFRVSTKDPGCLASGCCSCYCCCCCGCRCCCCCWSCCCLYAP